MYHHNDAARGLQVQPTSSPSQAAQLARVGQTRCYWALLSSKLDFVFLDPVLAHHLGPQKDVFVGRSLLEFVHPDEQASAATDLKGVLDSRTLHGSVTRVRYCRLSKIRKLLGFSGTPEIPTVMRPVFYDDSYMACDLVINLAADGLVLCFIHAVIDIRPEDNDEHARTHWTNWCGTSSGGITPELAAFLPRQLEHVCPPIVSAPSDRVFQLLDNAAERTVLFSWPPAAPRDDYGRLARDIQMQFTSPDGGTPPPSDGAAKTSCTRRYKAQQWMMFGDSFEREIESIFIPYGCIIFACHKTVQTRSLQTYPQNPLQQSQQQYFFDSPQQQQQPQPQQQQQQPFHTGGFGIDNWGSGPYLPHSQPATPSQWGPSPQLPAVLPTPPPAASTDDGAESPSQSTSSGEAPAPAKGKRAGGNPPAGVTKCSHCKIKTSPEWRKGPSGKKDLCNACGLRYARSRAKREGHPVQRRKKEKPSVETTRAKKVSSPKTEQQWLDPAAAIMAFQQQQPFEQQQTYAFQHSQQQMYAQQQQFSHGHDALSLLSSASFERAAEQEKATHDKSPGPVYVQ